jgi:hypothetical protein
MRPREFTNLISDLSATGCALRSALFAAGIEKWFTLCRANSRARDIRRACPRSGYARLLESNSLDGSAVENQSPRLIAPPDAVQRSATLSFHIRILMTSQKLKSIVAAVPSSRRRTATEAAAPQPHAPPHCWNGHLPATRLALENILLRARVGTQEISQEERVLVNACELRCDVEAGGWHTRMHENRSSKLNTARYILSELGAQKLEAHIAETMEKLKAAPSPQSETVLLRYLERRLIAEGAMLDALIAEYAEKLPKPAPTAGA